MRYHLTTLGCQMNHSDSERVRTVMDGMGLLWTDHEEEADLLGVLACSVRQKAIDKVYTRIHRWNQWKSERSLVTFVSGCVLADDQAKFLKLFDLVFTMNELPRVPELLRQYGMVTPLSVRASVEPAVPTGPAATVIPLAAVRPCPPNRPVMTGLWQLDATPASAFAAYVPIQNGCDKFCTFCAVPYTRGREVSRPSAAILREVQSLVDRGYQSITLLGQNVNSYGHDKPGAELNFAALLRGVGEMGERAGRRFWVYFTSPHPRDMTDEVLETVARYPCLAKQIHLPLQSGDDQVLLRMNRQHSVGQYRSIVHTIRRLLPEATLYTDIIVGFSGETAAQSANTQRVLEEMRYNNGYLALYSPRPGTASSRWPDDVPRDEKLRRFHALNNVLIAHGQAYNDGLIGRTVPVLVTGRDGRSGCLEGLTEGKLNVRVAVDNPAWIGKFIDVTLTSAQPFALAGELVNVAV